MSLEVADGERGIVRVFRIEADRAGAWADLEGPGWPLPGALGVDRLATADVQVFAVRDIAEIGLADFLAQGYDVTEAELGPVRESYDALETGVIAVLRSGAFAAPVTIRLADEVTHLGTFHEPSARTDLARMPDVASARPKSAPPPADEEREDEDGDQAVLARFHPDRDTYVRGYLWLAAAAMVAATAVLYLLGNPDPWVGAVAALLAIGVRGAYLASEELGRRYELTDTSVRSVAADGRVERWVARGDIAQVRRLGSAVQIITRDGHKFLLKHLAEPDDVRAHLARAAGVAQE